MDTNDISPGKPNKYSYLLPTYAQKDPFVFYPESYVYAVSGNPTPSGKPRPYLTRSSLRRLVVGSSATKQIKIMCKRTAYTSHVTRLMSQRGLTRCDVIRNTTRAATQNTIRHDAFDATRYV